MFNSVASQLSNAACDSSNFWAILAQANNNTGPQNFWETGWFGFLVFVAIDKNDGISRSSRAILQFVVLACDEKSAIT